MGICAIDFPSGWFILGESYAVFFGGIGVILLGVGALCGAGTMGLRIVALLGSLLVGGRMVLVEYDIPPVSPLVGAVLLSIAGPLEMTRGLARTDRDFIQAMVRIGWLFVGAGAVDDRICHAIRFLGAALIAVSVLSGWLARAGVRHKLLWSVGLLFLFVGTGWNAAVAVGFIRA